MSTKPPNPPPPEHEKVIAEWEKITQAAMDQAGTKKEIDAEARVFIYNDSIMHQLFIRILHLEARLVDLESMAELKRAWEEWQDENK